MQHIFRQPPACDKLTVGMKTQILNLSSLQSASAPGYQALLACIQDNSFTLEETVSVDQPGRVPPSAWQEDFWFFVLGRYQSLNQSFTLSRIWNTSLNIKLQGR